MTHPVEVVRIPLDLSTESAALTRRRFMVALGGTGLGTGLLPGVLWARSQEATEITADVLEQAEKVAGLEFTSEEREMMLRGLQRNLEAYAELHEVTVPNEVPPALHFEPHLPGWTLPSESGPVRFSHTSGSGRPARLEDVAFWSLRELGELIRTRAVRCVELTQMYLNRLERHGPTLECAVTFTTERALAQAESLDAELARGHYRGPLHGIPWGAKDLLSVRGYPTTWGAKPFENQDINNDATVVRRLDEAGAVLIGKLSLGALAMGDVWFGGRTRNPWNLEQGSSGSSAGSASATVAGLVGFAMGSETLGSIVSPSTRCGATGLRPTFGRVSRAGAMALSWSMDKLGPLCRTVEDCAVVLDAIHGADGRDPTARTVPFAWNAGAGLGDLRIGYLQAAFESEGATPFDAQALTDLRALGVDPVPVSLPDRFPIAALRIILNAEAGAAFDELTRSGADDELVRQMAGAWPNAFRTSRLIPAVEYIQANRVRTMLMEAVHAALDGIDVFITPSFGGNVLLTTNLTGHPTVVVPSGFRDDGTPTSISFVGQLWADGETLAVAKAYQDSTGHHRAHPERFT